MQDKKNIVIKVSFPAQENQAISGLSTPQVVTVWHIKRLLLAGLAGVLLLVLLWFLFKPTPQPTLPAPQAIKTEPLLIKQAQPKAEAKVVNRSLLTLQVVNNEPFGELIPPLKINKDAATSVYYFVELAAMDGRTVYHEWLLDNELITRKQVNVSGDKWRTASRQLLMYSNRTDWTVRLVDETGQILNTIPFKVIYE